MSRLLENILSRSRVCMGMVDLREGCQSNFRIDSTIKNQSKG